jgi:hypothetical protein
MSADTQIDTQVVCVLPPDPLHPDPLPREARLADVLVTTGTRGEAAERCVALLADCPGASLVVVVCSDGTLMAGARHGSRSCIAVWTVARMIGWTAAGRRCHGGRAWPSTVSFLLAPSSSSS